MIQSGPASPDLNLYHKNLSNAVTLGGAYDGGGASEVNLQGHVISCSDGLQTPHDALSVICNLVHCCTTLRKCHLKRLVIARRIALKLTQGYRNCRCSIGHSLYELLLAVGFAAAAAISV